MTVDIRHKNLVIVAAQGFPEQRSLPDVLLPVCRNDQGDYFLVHNDVEGRDRLDPVARYQFEDEIKNQQWFALDSPIPFQRGLRLIFSSVSEPPEPVLAEHVMGWLRNYSREALSRAEGHLKAHNGKEAAFHAIWSALEATPGDVSLWLATLALGQMIVDEGEACPGVTLEVVKFLQDHINGFTEEGVRSALSDWLENDSLSGLAWMIRSNQAIKGWMTRLNIVEPRVSQEPPRRQQTAPWLPQKQGPSKNPMPQRSKGVHCFAQQAA